MEVELDDGGSICGTKTSSGMEESMTTGASANYISRRDSKQKP